MTADGTESPPETESLDADQVVRSDLGEEFTVRELGDRVTLLKPGIFLMREVPGGGKDTLQILTATFEQRAADLDAYGVIVDLPAAESNKGKTVTAEYRKFIPQHFETIFARSKGRLKIIVVTFRGSQVLRVVGKFLIGRMVTANIKIEKDVDSALAVIEAELAKSV